MQSEFKCGSKAERNGLWDTMATMRVEQTVYSTVRLQIDISVVCGEDLHLDLHLDSNLSTVVYSVLFDHP